MANQPQDLDQDQPLVPVVMNVPTANANDPGKDNENPASRVDAMGYGFFHI